MPEPQQTASAAAVQRPISAEACVRRAAAIALVRRPARFVAGMARRASRTRPWDPLTFGPRTDGQRETIVMPAADPTIETVRRARRKAAYCRANASRLSLCAAERNFTAA